MAKEDQTVKKFLLETIDSSLLEQPLNRDTKWDLRATLLDIAKALARDLRGYVRCNNCGHFFKDSESVFCPLCQDETPIKHLMDS